jgi:hypothetical protein
MGNIYTVGTAGLTLSQAITDANGNPGSTIEFALSSDTYTLTGNLPAITATDLTIDGTNTTDGNSITIDGGGKYQGFYVSSGTATIENLTLQDTAAIGLNGSDGTLSSNGAPTLTDTASLAGGSGPTGTITFTLYYDGGTTPVDTETVSVNGNGTYSTPTGYTLPTTGTVTGTYQWDAAYSGDPNNNPVSEIGNAAEQVVVSSASPTLTTTASLVVSPLNSAVTFSDSAVLAGGYDPTGSITFTLTNPAGATVDTETVSVNNNGNETDMLMRNSNTGVFALFDISKNALTVANPNLMGQIGLEWSISGVSATPASAPPATQLSGIAADPAGAAPSSATAQLTQAMASFAPSAGTAAASSPLEQTTAQPSAAANVLTTTNQTQPI